MFLRLIDVDWWWRTKFVIYIDPAIIECKVLTNFFCLFKRISFLDLFVRDDRYGNWKFTKLSNCNLYASINMYIYIYNDLLELDSIHVGDSLALEYIYLIVNLLLAGEYTWLFNTSPEKTKFYGWKLGMEKIIEN